MGRRRCRRRGGDRKSGVLRIPRGTLWGVACHHTVTGLEVQRQCFLVMHYLCTLSLRGPWEHGRVKHRRRQLRWAGPTTGRGPEVGGAQDFSQSRANHRWGHTHAV